MPRDNWMAGQSVSPDWVDPDHEHLFPGLRDRKRDYIPDPEAPPEVTITPEQEKYGLAWKEGDPIPKPKRVKAFLVPNNETV